jgi:hypothetical protein
MPGRRRADLIDVLGWDAASLAEFDRQWIAGVPQADMAAAFAISRRWLNTLRKRRGLSGRYPGRCSEASRQIFGAPSARKKLV